MPHLASAVVGVDVGSHAASGVLAACLVEQQLACTCVAQVSSIGMTLVNHEEFQSGAVGVEVCQMEGVAMTESGGVE